MQVDQDRRDFASELRDAMRVLRSNWWLVLLCTALAAGAAYLWTEQVDPVYESQSKVLLLQQNPAAALEGAPTFGDPARQRATDIQIVRQTAVAVGVIRRLGLDTSAGELLSRVSATAPGDSNVLTITVEANRRDQTTDVANAFADEFVEFSQRTNRQRYRSALRLVRQRLDTLEENRGSRAEIRRLRGQVRQLSLLASVQTGGAQVIERAQGFGGQVSPDEERNVLLAALAGLLLGVALAFIRDRLDPRLRSERDVRRAAPGIPVLGSIPRLRRRDRWMAEEGFHNLGASLDATTGNGRIRSLLVTGTMPDEGKSTTATNLAAALSGPRRRVAVVEADLRDPGISKRLGVNGQPGVSSVLAGDGDVDGALGTATVSPPVIRRHGPALVVPGEFQLLPAGPLPDSPRKLLEDETLGQLLEGVKARADTVIVDGPPLGMFSDVMPIAKRVDGVLVAVRLGRTRRAALESLLENLAHASIVPIGLVILGTRGKAPTYGSGGG